MLLGIGVVVTLTPLIVGTLFAHRVLRMNPVVVCGALAGAMTVDAAVTGACEVAESQTPVLGVAVPYAIANVVLTVLGPRALISSRGGHRELTTVSIITVPDLNRGVRARRIPGS